MFPILSLERGGGPPAPLVARRTSPGYKLSCFFAVQLLTSFTRLVINCGKAGCLGKLANRSLNYLPGLAATGLLFATACFQVRVYVCANHPDNAPRTMYHHAPPRMPLLYRCFARVLCELKTPLLQLDLRFNTGPYVSCVPCSM